MNNLEKAFFASLEKEAERNPLIKVRAAAEEVTEILKESCMKGENMIKGDLWLYYLSVLTGISCIKTAMMNVSRLTKENIDNPEYVPIIKLETDMGVFYMGDAINDYIFYNRDSVWNTLFNIYLSTHKESSVPEIKNIIYRNSANLGRKGYKVWNSLHNPYDERLEAKKIYENIEKHLEPFKLKQEQIPMVYGTALALVLNKVEGIFPKELDCLDMVLETVVFNAHMDYA